MARALSLDLRERVIASIEGDARAPGEAAAEPAQSLTQKPTTARAA